MKKKTWAWIALCSLLAAGALALVVAAPLTSEKKIEGQLEHLYDTHDPQSGAR